MNIAPKLMDTKNQRVWVLMLAVNNMTSRMHTERIKRHFPDTCKGVGSRTLKGMVFIVRIFRRLISHHHGTLHYCKPKEVLLVEGPSI